MRDAQLPDVFDDCHGHRQDPFRIGQGADDDKLFTAVAGTEVTGPTQGFLDGLGDFQEAIAACTVTVGIVIALEIIYVTHQNGERLLLSFVPVDFM